ncbi:FDXHR family putative zinc-binding protein [Brachybacterium paraconglomeratum]|uniref:FDXHR family putative zinc-binding protein n=1 Tax=Brachybacterium paraconglomeratum TaxID=173362 RepID=UPI003F791580
MSADKLHSGIAWDESTESYAVALGGKVLGHFPTQLQALRALENGTGHTLGDVTAVGVGGQNGTGGQPGPVRAPEREPSQRLTAYQLIVARLRAECVICAEDADRPEHVSLRSWHNWGRSYAGAPDTDHPHCGCGTELRNGTRFWHCGGCHETFAGEDAFTRHRRGPGDARYCLEPQNTGRARDWRRLGGVWHYGSRREVPGAPELTPPSAEPVAA